MTTVGVDAVQAALLHGHDQPPHSPEGSLAAPAAKSATSASGHRVVGGWLAFTNPKHPRDDL